MYRHCFDKSTFCDNCTNEYSNTFNGERIPKVLKCGDTFCLQCINSLSKNDRSIKCQKAVTDFCKQIEDVIQEGIDKGKFKPCNAQSLSFLIFSTTYSMALCRVKDENATSEDTSEDFINSIISGIKKEE